MKNIVWIPRRCQNLHEEIFYLDYYVGHFRGLARYHSSFRTTRSQLIDGRGTDRIACEVCRVPQWPIAAHHILPIWACAVEHLCSMLILDDSHLQWGVWKAPHPETISPPFYEIWNSRENLILLCPACHRIREKNVFSEQKSLLTEKYSPFLCFGRAEAEKQWRKREKEVTQ